MALSDKRIKNEMEKEHIIIAPFDERNLSTSSYDVTLGKNFYRMKRDIEGMFNIYSKEDTAEVWGDLEEAVNARDTGIMGDGINEDDQIIIMQPGDSILAHTNEFIGGRGHITTMMKARSSMGRQGITVCRDAGWGDVGYINRWTMEITNNTPHIVPLVVGRRIAQIVFFDTGEILGPDYTSKGNYAASNVLEELENAWSPEDMLPRMWKDRDIKA